jgi:hypothetical protein
VFRLTLPRIAGADLVGSPLPLAPDEAELAEVLGADGLAETNGVSAVDLVADRAAGLVAGGLAETNGVSAADPAAASAPGPVADSAAGGVIGVIAAGQADPARDAEDRGPATGTVAAPAGATEPASRG